MDFVIKEEMRFDQGRVTYEELLAMYLRLRESSKLVVEHVAARSEKPKTDKTSIIAKTMFGRKGSATREEGRRLASERHEENIAEKAGEAARKEDNKQIEEGAGSCCPCHPWCKALAGD